MTDYASIWPKTADEAAQYLDDIANQFPGWDEYTSKEKGEELYNLSVELASEMMIVALNFAAEKFGLSMMQASMVPGKAHLKLFGKL